MTRLPAVADRFYPGDPEHLRSAMKMLVPAVPETEKQQAQGVVMPHAGYIYSGATAGNTISRVRVPETVLVLGPNHHGRGAALALGTDDWQMPMGTVSVDRQLATTILRHAPRIVEDSEAHVPEHSLEVQVPFLQQVQPKLRLVPLMVAQVSYEICQSVARGLAAAIREFGKPVLIVASTDMSHYESRPQAAKKDRMAIERILALDPQGLYATVLGSGISMCGVIPTALALLVELELGATRAELVQYTDSGEASGDIRQVVGYAGLIIS
ncbi:MAG: AmmeMemoRadiSam system protein B [Desulfobulbus sp.]|jgi:AmmeMemoRadiSam system protein B|uniref:AmmeMemoRadiSam system protein B n=1 Tax=Desulfobulbus sp. TaxID=895 RepID=UPI0028524669|nr:AmmeMemoRadiSam system protein B [Desulfobulbus sp.]MDR2550002.1 AmmeMemoRadiSam system protein B [Desulfobulbus sp.]